MSSTFAWHDSFTKDRQSSMESHSALFGYNIEEEENRFFNQDGPQGVLIDMDSSLNAHSLASLYFCSFDNRCCVPNWSWWRSVDHERQLLFDLYRCRRRTPQNLSRQYGTQR